MTDADDLDMGDLILPKRRKCGEVPADHGTLLPWFALKGAKRQAALPPECAARGGGSNTEGKRPVEQADAPLEAACAAKLGPEPVPWKGIDAVDAEHVKAVTLELQRVRAYVMQREHENNAAYKRNEFPAWRLVPPKRRPGVAGANPTRPPNPRPVLAVGEQLLLDRLLSCDDDVQLAKLGAVLVPYADFVRASNEKVDTTLLGGDDKWNDARHMIAYSNRESVSFNYAMKNLWALITSVPAFNGDHRLTGMQRLATALMTEGYDKDVNITVKRQNLPQSETCDACYRLPPFEMPLVLINNLTVASGKTRATIFSTMRHLATPEAWKATKATRAAHRLAARTRCPSWRRASIGRS